MGKHLPKGILQLTKSFERNKRVTFNDDVTVEEFNSNSAIIQTVVRKQTGKDDVTEKNTDDATKVLPKTKTDCNLHQKNDTRNAHEECNNGNGGKDYDERNGISTNNGTECSSETLGEATSAMDVIPFESVVESKMLSEVVKKADADTESGHVQNEITEKELEEAIEDANEDSIALNSLHAPPKSYEMNTKAEKSENSENNTSAASKIPHRTLKKRLSANNMNLPAIREEINSRLNDVTMEVNDVYKETTNGQNSAEILVEDKDKVPESPKFPEDRDFLIQKARDDARLCALRGQIAADKAAWSCVVRYPRNTLSQPGSGRSSPLTPDVIRAAAKSPLSTIERKNPFPLSNSPPLTIYKPNFGPKNGTSRLSTFPPLTTPTSVGESRLVTQRNSAMWMPDISHVNNNRRRRITVKGSNITIRELRK